MKLILRASCLSLLIAASVSGFFAGRVHSAPVALEPPDEYQAGLAWFKRGARDRKEVCLTIDDGPHGASTATILNVLRREQVPAAFFVVGKRMLQHPALVQRMIAEGHEVGNHTASHPRLNQIRLSLARRELVTCEQEFEAIAHRRMTLFRPPGMKDNRAVLLLAKSLGYQTVDWNVGAKDFALDKRDPRTFALLARLSSTPRQIADRVIRQVKNGSIILLHDQPATAAALPMIVSSLKARGFSFVTCSEALAHLPKPVMVASNPRFSGLRLAANVSPSRTSHRHL